MTRPSRTTQGAQRSGEPKSRSVAGSAEAFPEPAKPHSLAVFVAPPAFVIPAPEETKEFQKAAHGNPRLRDEQRRLLAEYPKDELVALAGTLLATFGFACSLRRRRGPRPLAVPAPADREAQVWGARIADRAAHADLDRNACELRAMMAEAIGQVAALLPKGASENARRDRANTLVDAYVRDPPSTTQLSADVIRNLAEKLSRKGGDEK
jgi:hypothetical protein